MKTSSKSTWQFCFCLNQIVIIIHQPATYLENEDIVSVDVAGFLGLKGTKLGLVRDGFCGDYAHFSIGIVNDTEVVGDSKASPVNQAVRDII